MDDARLIELETRLAYQDDTLRVLNDVIVRQQKQIERLETLYRQLSDRLERVAQPDGRVNTPAEEVPPHY